jgi:hypothetical protein
MALNPATPTIVVQSPPSSNLNYFWLNLLSTLIIGGGTMFLTYRLLRWRDKQEYIMARGAGLTLEEDIKRVEARLEKSAGSRDHWHTEFLTDLRKVAANGLLRPARCREEHIVELMNLRKRNLPVISTIVAPPGAGKSRMAEGTVHALYHDRNGNHHMSRAYDAKNRLFPDVDPAGLLAFRLNLGQLTHVDAEPMFHYLMRRADECVKNGGKCLVLIDEAHLLYEHNGHASAARLIHQITGWTDGQMQHNKGLWALAGMRDSKYDGLVRKKATQPKNISFARRFERFDMPILSGGPLRALVEEVTGEWEERARIKIPSEVRDRAVELMAHPANELANPYAVLNLLDRVQAAMQPGEVMDRRTLDRNFANLHRLGESEVAQWSLYEEIKKSIKKELEERFNIRHAILKAGYTKDLDEEAPLLAKFANSIFNAWLQSDQRLIRAENESPMIPEVFIEQGVENLYSGIEAQDKNKPAQDLRREMRAADKGPRLHRTNRVAHISTPQGHRPAANA